MGIKITGCIPFYNRKERRKIYDDLKKEFGTRVKINVKDNLISYSGFVTRDQAYM